MNETMRLSESGRETEERILQSALALFSKKWYGTTSVAEICRAAELSNGVFYRYFKNKEEICKALLGATFNRIKDALAGVEGQSSREKLVSFVDILVAFSYDHPDLISVYREGQYRFIEYEGKLDELYRRSLSLALGTEADPPACLFALGGIRFCAIRRGLQSVNLDLPSIKRIVEGGLFPGLEARSDLVFLGPVQPLPLDIEEGAKEVLLRSGKHLFGERGFFETNIHEITDESALSVGAFYTYFESKESFYAELLRRANHDIRRFIAGNMPDGLNRLEKEMRGLWLFVLFLQSDKHCYNLVREAEYILPEDAKAYYSTFVNAYRKHYLHAEGLSPEIDETTAVEFLLGISHYTGINSVFEDKAGNIRAKVEAIGQRMASGFSDCL